MKLREYNLFSPVHGSCDPIAIEWFAKHFRGNQTWQLLIKRNRLNYKYLNVTMISKGTCQSDNQVMHYRSLLANFVNFSHL